MRLFRSVFISAAVAALLTSCSGTEDDISSFLTDQDKYDFYSCPQIAQNLESATKRVRELERVMATASRGTGGDVVNAVTYRPEYLTQRGNMNVLIKTARQKHCDLPALKAAEKR